MKIWKRRLCYQDNLIKKLLSNAEVLDIISRNDDCIQVLNLDIVEGQEECRSFHHITQTIRALRGNTSVVHINLQLNGFSLELINELSISLTLSSICDIDILPCSENLSAYFFQCLQERYTCIKEKNDDKETKIQSIYVAQLNDLNHAESLASFLVSCHEHVRDLALRNYTNESLQIVIRALVERTNGIESLSLPKICGIDVIQVYQMLAKCPCLKSLELCIGGGDSNSNILPTFHCCGRLSLKSLSINMSYIKVSSRINFFNSLPLLCPELSSLHLEFEGISDIDTLFWGDVTVGRALADLHHLNELSIEYMHLKADFFITCRPILQNIHYLKLNSYGNHGLDNISSVVSKVLKASPNLKHLSIRITNETEFHQYLQIIQEMMPNLEALTICDLHFLPGKQELELKLLRSLKSKSHLVNVDYPDVETKIALSIHREIEFDCMLRFLNRQDGFLFLTSQTTLQLFPFLCEKLIRHSWIDVIYYILLQNQQILNGCHKLEYPAFLC
jgi:hypothetical protein